jgi:hypothetical protein
MPKFHFPIVDGVTLPDPVGIDLENSDQAKSHAKNIARHIALADPKRQRNVVVMDEDGEEVDRVSVRSDAES